MIRAIVGANWGDEGKGKITDMFAAKSDIVIRFQGGANAGHTIINEHGRFAFHLMPSGVCYDHTTCIIGNGVALDINKFLTELEDVKAAGLNPHLLVSERCQILMPYHILLDTYEEERLGKNAFGSTKSGIAPFFSDKFSKIGIQVNELFDEEALRTKLENICTLKNLVLEHVYHKPLLHVDDLFATCMEYRDKIAPYVCDTHAYLQKAVQEDKNILLEGQLTRISAFIPWLPPPPLWPVTVPSAPGCRPTRSRILWWSPRPIPPPLAPENLCLRSWMRTRPRNCGSTAATRANSALPPADLAVWAGLTAWLPATA